MPTNAASYATAPRMRSARVRSVVSASGSGLLIEPCLQDDLRRDLVALAAAFASAAGERRLRDLRRVALVGKRDGNREAVRKALAESSRVPRHGMRRPVGVHRKADDDEVGMPFAD